MAWCARALISNGVVVTTPFWFESGNLGKQNPCPLGFIRGQNFAVLAGGTGKFADIGPTIINADVAICGAAYENANPEIIRFHAR